MWIAISNAIGSRQLVGGGPGPGPGPDPVPSLPGGFAAAYSVRKLDSAYAGSCLEAYRVSDGATQDIGFDGNGDLDTAAIISFAGGGEVRVRTWYDQSGNGVDATQTTDTFMPRIYDGAAIYEENGKPTLAWTAQGQHMDTTPNESITAQSNFVVFNMNSTSGGFARVLAQAETGQDDYFAGQYSALLKSPTVNSLMATYDGNGAPEVNNASAYNTQHLWTAIANGTASDVWLDSGTEGSASTTLSPTLNMANLTIRTIGGAAGFNQDRLVGNIQEVLIYNTDEEAAGNRGNIEYNVNDYYSIFSGNQGAPTSGFLFDYSGAAAAYSVRQLSNNATLALRVRRNVAPFDEQDIGFDSNGDLDTAAIATFGGSDALTVSRWYDQSGNLFNATPPSSGAQPRIYDGASVELENGKPVMAPLNNNTQFRVSLDLVGDFVDMFAVQQRYSTLSMGFGTTSTNGSWFGYARNASGSASSPSDSMEYGINGGALEALKTRLSLYNDTANQTLVYYRNPNPTRPFTASWTDLVLGYHTGGISMPRFQEVILWQNDDQIANRTGIESNINGYFNVYTVYNPDAPTSGFLFDYSGAAVAYSVRQLNNNATTALRVRRTVAPFDEQDIGFDANGDLDTAAISTFGGSDSLTVSHWYDQTGNQNHATQVTASSQPQIYDGVAVLTENGNPVIGFDGLKSLSTNASISTSAATSFIVGGTQNGGSFGLGPTGNSSVYYGVGQSGSGSNSSLNVTLSSTHINGTSYSSPTRDQIFANMASQGLLSTLFNLNSGTELVELSYRYSSLFDKAQYQEYVLYLSDQSANRTGIETNINTYYSIY